MTTDQKQDNEQDSTKNVASFLFGLIIFSTSGFIVKLAWNLGIASLFRVQNISYIHAITWLTLLYIAARVVSAGFMAEVERTIAHLVEQLESFSKIAQNVTDASKTRSVSNNTDESDLN